MTTDQAIDKVISLAESEIGYHEKKTNANLEKKTASNDGSGNWTKYGVQMHEILPSVMDLAAAWCDAFVDWLFFTIFGTELAKKILCGNFDDYTIYSANYYKKAGRYDKNPKKGDQVFFQSGGKICHTGLIKMVTSSYIYTIEGNKGDCVKSCKYSRSDSRIDGYGHPKYELAADIETKTETTANSAAPESKIPVATSKSKFAVSGTGSPSTKDICTGTVTASSLNCRRWAGTDADLCKTVGPLYYGQQVQIKDAILDGDAETWYYIGYGSKTAFVCGRYVEV